MIRMGWAVRVIMRACEGRDEGVSCGLDSCGGGSWC